VLIPRFLLTGKYSLFGLYIILTAALLIIIHRSIEMFYLGTDVEFFSTIAILDNISEFFINILCLAGFSIPVFLRNWMISRQRVNQLEKNKMSSEVQQLKEQINPAFLFDILGSTSVLVKTEPKKASAMLMKLSQLLRYQLYDCNRDMVLLSSEVKFLRNFMELEQLHSSDLKFTIATEGDIEKLFVPPLLFFTFVQIAVKSLDIAKKGNISIHIAHLKNKITLIIKIEGVFNMSLSANELQNSKERLTLLYNDNYSLIISDRNEENHPAITLKIDSAL